mgnify:CR=1 FL=1
MLWYNQIRESIHLEVDKMCDVVKYTKIYNEIKNLEPEDTLQLVLESEDEDEKDFYEMIGNFLLQQKQKKVIERNVY